MLDCFELPFIFLVMSCYCYVQQVEIDSPPYSHLGWQITLFFGPSDQEVLLGNNMPEPNKTKT